VDDQNKVKQILSRLSAWHVHVGATLLMVNTVSKRDHRNKVLPIYLFIDSPGHLWVLTQQKKDGLCVY